MSKLFTEDESHPMARALEQNSKGIAPGADAAHAAPSSASAPSSQPHGTETANHNRPPVARHVCPFCGNLNESPQGTCPRCAMENTPQIRNATKARIGPWYVLQTRNPAAPGMRFDTLLGFVRKGRIKPKSVVRGPTTHQLWRHAFQVKGLSREFGVCYSCGGTIEQTAKVCGRCNRLQDPPANPDALLENEDGSASGSAALSQTPVYKELKPATNDADIVIPPLRSGSKNSTPAISALSAPAVAASASVADVVVPDSSRFTADDHPSIASNVFALDEPHEMDREHPAAGHGNPMLVASDLAAAFRLNVGSEGGDSHAYASVSDGSGEPVRMPGILARDLPPMYIRRHSPGKIVATILFLGVLATALWLIVDNSARDKAMTWFSDSFSAVKRTANNPIKPHLKDDVPDPSEAGIGTKGASSGRNDPLLPDPLPENPPATAVKKPEVPDKSPQDTFPVDTAVKPLKPPVASQAAKSAVPAKLPDADFPVTVPEDPAAQPNVALPAKAPAPTATKPAPAPTPANVSGSSDATDDDSPALKAQREGAMLLFRQANDAMQGRNFSNAAKIYEQIKQKYPKEAWPGGLELKLRLAKRSAGEP